MGKPSRSSPHLRTIIITTALAVPSLCAAATPDSTNTGTIVPDTQCDCFLTNGTSPGLFFSHHIFFDFRSLPQYAPPSGVDSPPFVLNASQAAIAPPTSAYFGGQRWNGTWQIQGWDNTNAEGHGLAGNSTVLMVNSQSNIFIQPNADARAPASQTYLSMRTKRLPGFQTTAAFQSRAADFQFLSVRFLARTIGSSGAVTAMFTYREDDGKGSAAASAIQEADLEVLTRAPREKVQYTNQPGFTPGGSRNTVASLNTTLPDSLLWSDWAVHRLDWTPSSTTWFVNGKQTANISVQVPRLPSSLNFNSWSDGGPWSGNMSLYDEARLEIQWIQVVYNTSDAQADPAPAMHARAHDQSSSSSSSSRGNDRDHLGPRGPLVRRKGSPGCKVVCSIDESPELGKAALLWNSTATRTAAADLKTSLSWLYSLMLGITIWFYLT